MNALNLNDVIPETFNTMLCRVPLENNNRQIRYMDIFNIAHLLYLFTYKISFLLMIYRSINVDQLNKL